MSVHRVSALPVMFACAGCPEFGDAAAQLALRLDRRGVAEAALLGAAADAEQLATKARSRFPVHAVDGCVKGCARRWLLERGARVERHFILAA
jgi:uncharacterized metal-binding protein